MHSYQKQKSSALALRAMCWFVQKEALIVFLLIVLRTHWMRARSILFAHYFAALRASCSVLFLTALLTSFSGCMGNAQSTAVVFQSSDTSKQVAILAAQLGRQGIRVMDIGETVTVVVPSDPLFQGDSANLNPSSFYRLNKVADFLKLYPKTFVEVSGYTDLSEDRARARLLTTRQAASVVHYLWSRGVDSRMMNAVGYGLDRLIVNGDLSSGNAENRRIEIYFQYDK